QPEQSASARCTFSPGGFLAQTTARSVARRTGTSKRHPHRDPTPGPLHRVFMSATPSLTRQPPTGKRAWQGRRCRAGPARPPDTAYGGRLLSASTASQTTGPSRQHFRFHAPHTHLSSVFGDDWFAVKAESFARFFGTPTFLIGQTIVVGVWMALNIAGVTHFDLYPFILLNLAFSLQAAYAAPLILLAQTRQADRDKAHTEADIQHREALAAASAERQNLAVQQSAQMIALLEQNIVLT